MRTQRMPASRVVRGSFMPHEQMTAADRLMPLMEQPVQRNMEVPSAFLLAMILEKQTRHTWSVKAQVRLGSLGPGISNSVGSSAADGKIRRGFIRTAILAGPGARRFCSA